MSQSVLVVGAAGSLGSAVSKRLAGKYRMVLVDREFPGHRPLDSTDTVRYEVGDIREVATCQKIGRLAADYDVCAVVNCAGVACDGTVDIADPDLVELIEVNLLGSIRIAKAVVPHFVRRGSGNLVTIVSRSGLHARRNLGAYAASKFGFIGYSDALNLEYADIPVRSTCICPGLVNTPMSADEPFPADALIQPDDVAACVELPLRLSSACLLLPLLLEPKCQINSRAPSVTGVRLQSATQSIDDGPPGLHAGTSPEDLHTGGE